MQCASRYLQIYEADGDGRWIFRAPVSAKIDRMIERLQMMLRTTIKFASLRGVRSARV
jgi:hypothetical protein